MKKKKFNSEFTDEWLRMELVEGTGSDEIKLKLLNSSQPTLSVASSESFDQYETRDHLKDYVNLTRSRFNRDQFLVE